jgi:dethiobiotin synthetase
MSNWSCFVTGTDTGVGKTHVCVELMRLLAQRVPRVVGMKPVAAGTMPIEGGGVDNEDAICLRQAATLPTPAHLNNPVLLPDAVSPHLAAQRAGVSIDLAHIVNCHRQLLQQADAVVVEGAGGFCVPLSDTETGADLAKALQLPVVLVVGLRLGCLNHALLTALAIQTSGVPFLGWVANHMDANMQAAQNNIDYLRQHLSSPLLMEVPHASTGQRVMAFHADAWLPAATDCA